MNARVVMFALVVGLVLAVGGWLWAARSRRPSHPSARSPRRPKVSSFRGQAVLILLPVIGLAGFGLVAIRQERGVVAEQARESALALARQMAADLERALTSEWSVYHEARSGLTASWEIILGSRPLTPENPPDVLEHRAIAWERTHPGIRLADSPEAQVMLEAADETADPPRSPAEGHPPRWVAELAPPQRHQWHAIHTALAQGNTNEAQSGLERFVASSVPDQARVNGEFLQACLAAQAVPSETALRAIMTFQRQPRDVVSETGVPLRRLALLQALRLTPTGFGLDRVDLPTVLDLLPREPSHLDPLVLAELKRIAGPAPTGRPDPIQALESLVATKRRTAECVARYLGQPATRPQPRGPLWLDGADGACLLWEEPVPAERTGSSAETVPLEPRILRLFPAPAVLGALNQGARAFAPLIPGYARCQIDFAGRTLTEPAPGATRTELATLPVLAETTNVIRVAGVIGDGTRCPELRVRFELVDAPFLYAQERRRAWLFGSLVLAATLTAMVGLGAAHRAFRRQVRLNELKSNFVSSVSHELRAPLASIRLLAEGLDRGQITDEAKRREYFRLIGRECRRLSALIENVLDFARIDRGRKQYEFELTDLAALVRQTVQLMEPYAAERRVRLELVPSPDSDLTPELDGKAVQQALVNLIDNAVKHSPPESSVTVTVCDGPMENGSDPKEVAGVSGPRYVTLVVADRGPGIPAAEHQRVFEPFYRLGSELRRETTGVGIGLSIVQHVVEGHGGRIRLESEVGQGSRFILELPVGPRSVAPGRSPSSPKAFA